MKSQGKHWKAVSRSQFPWEQEALDFIYDQFPAQDHYRAWSNFEFLGDDGSINEVDLLVACPQGVFLIEIKSWPGEVSGDARDWTRSHEGQRRTDENPVILANRKCKRLKSLLARQKCFKKLGRVPFIEPLIFLSHSEIKCRLTGNAAHFVRLRDTGTRPGIMGAIRRRECPGLKELDHQLVNRPQIKTLALAMEQAGIRPSQRDRRVGDFKLEKLIFDSPLGIYQDWTARHVTMETTRRIARIYMVARQSTEEDREIIRNAAHREFRLLERLNHPGILNADPPTDCEWGPVLFLRQPPDAVRFDHFLAEKGDTLPVDQRLDLLRQIGETVAYAHGQKVVHRSLSPQSILIVRDPSGGLKVQLYNWQTGARLPGSLSSTLHSTQMSMTLHAGQLVEDSSQVYLAPEALLGGADGGTELDIFSLGALTYLLFSGTPPASSVIELQQKLKDSLSGGLNITSAMDGAVDSLVELVRCTANATPSDRISVQDFLAGLDLVEEELTQPEEDQLTNPLEAGKGDILAGGFRVVNRLGSGSVSVVFLIDVNGEQQVLKIARSPDYNKRIRDELEVLKDIRNKVRSRIVVAPYELLEFGDLIGFTMEPAGEKTMARFLREEGPLDLTYLQRFGDDLIRTIRDLDDTAGIAHRDIKPDNMGLRLVQKKQMQLCLFDFSLSKASPEDIRVGTPAYLDPFIAEREVKRWDISSECFSVAMTLHEMATGVLPTWGDGRSDPASVPGEANIQPERFDADLRDRFSEFFTKALRRDFRERFDNPSQMLETWNDIFKTVDQPKTTTHPEEETDKEQAVFQLPEHLSAGTQLVILGLSTRLLNALDRLSLVTVADLLGYPLRRIYKLPNVGNKTRRELGALVKELRQRLPDVETDPAKALAAIKDDEDTPDAFASVDLIAKQVAIIGRGTDRIAEQEILQGFLGWNRPDGEDPAAWPSQSDLAPNLDVTRQRIGQVVTEARERWKRYPSITGLRDTIHEMVRTQGGVVTHEELIQAVLTARGSAFEDPKRTQMASVATRAALETERAMQNSRFTEYRSGERIFVAMSSELKSFAVALGKEADCLASANPIPSPVSVVEALRKVKAPEFPEEVVAPTDQRLCQLAVSVSETAALSSRLEVYPVGLDPKRALVLAQNALFGGSMTVEEIQSRVAARLPRAKPIPGRPLLDKLIAGLGFELAWNPSAAGGRGAYEMPGAGEISIESSEILSSRMNTRVSPAPVGGEVSPDVAEALDIEKKLKFAARNGSYLVISAPPGLENKARIELERRFGVEVCDLDSVFISSMRDQASAAGAEWEAVLEIDAEPVGSSDWDSLQILVERCVPTITAQMRDPEHTKLVTHPGLLARYDQMHILNDLASDVGRSDGIHGLWVLVPANDQSPLPTLNHQAVPLTSPAAHVRLNKAWLQNKHRA